MHKLIYKNAGLYAQTVYLVKINRVENKWVTETVVLDRWLCPTDIGLGFHDLKGGPIIDLVYNLTQKSLKRFEQLIMLIAEANIC